MRLDNRKRRQLMKHRSVMKAVHARDEARLSNVTQLVAQLEAELERLRKMLEPFSIAENIGCKEVGLFTAFHTRLQNDMVKKNVELALGRVEVEQFRQILAISTQRKAALKKIFEK